MPERARTVDVDLDEYLALQDWFNELEIAEHTRGRGEAARDWFRGDAPARRTPSTATISTT